MNRRPAWLHPLLHPSLHAFLHAFLHKIAALSVCVAVVAPAWSQAVPTPYSYSRASSFTYQPNGLLASETIEPGSAELCVVTSYTYDAYGNRVSSTIANCPGVAGTLASFEARSSDSAFAQHVFTLGALSASVPAGSFATQSRIALTASLADPQSHSETRQYDPRFGAAVQLTGPNGLITSWQLDPFGRPELETRADATRTARMYCWLAIVVDGAAIDTSSNSARCPGGASPIDTPLSGEAPPGAVRFEHSEPQNAAGARIGAFTREYFDAAGRKLRWLTQAFDGAGQPAATGSLVVQDWTYNAFGAVLYATQPYFLASGSSQTTGVTGAGTGPYGVSATVHDALGRAVAHYTSDPGGTEPGYSFGPHGTRQASKTTIAYAALASTTTTYVPAALGAARVRIEEKNPEGRLVRTSDPMGAQLVHQHDAFGNLVATKDALQNITRIAYDVRGRKLQLQDPDAGVMVYCYDALGQLKAQQSSQMRASHSPAPCPIADGAGTVAPVRPGWSTMAYDRLGRMSERVDDGAYASKWSFDKYASGAACNKGKGKLCEATTTSGLARKAYYDDLGRALSSVLRVAGSEALEAAWAVSYDAAGRVAGQVYPSGLALSHEYTARGFLRALKLASALTINPLPASAGGTPGASTTLPVGTALWSAGAINAWGKVELSSYASAVNNRTGWDASTGRLLAASAGKGGAGDVLDQQLVWDNLGQLSQRIDALGDSGGAVQVLDTLQYDALGRLVQYGVSGGTPGSPVSRSVQLQYNALGMLLAKSDVANLSYPAQGAVGGVSGTQNRLVHAVQRAQGYHNADYGYDLQGSLNSASSSTATGKYTGVVYTSFNQPASLAGAASAGGALAYAWQYDESQQRLKETRSRAGALERTTWYLHPNNQGGLGMEREIVSAATPIHSNRHYLTAAGMAIGVIVTRGPLPVLGTQTAPPPVASMTAVKLEYWHKDHLGSLVATSDHAGAVTARYAYDPSGKRRYTNASYDPFGALVIDFTTDTNRGTDRGFTGHEHLDDVGIVHMNGRLYDPLIGRFLQADPFVQDPSNLQNFDRYQYCFNSPTTCTDPSGYFSLGKFLRGVAAIAVAFYAPYLLETYAGLSAGTFVVVGTQTVTFTGAATAGFFAGAISGGSLKSGVQGAFSGVVFAGVGQIVGDAGLGAAGNVRDAGQFAGAVALHGVAGCVTSVAGGGKCGALSRNLLNRDPVVAPIW